MRTAARDDVWRRVLRDDERPLALAAVHYQNLPGFAPGAVNFSKPITAICGANGAGKTALLMGIWLALDPAAAHGTANLLRMGEARIKAVVSHQGEVHEYAVDLAHLEPDDEPEVVTVYIDSAPSVMEIQQIFKDKEDIEAILNGIESIKLNPQDVKSLSYIVGKYYESVEIFETEEANGIVPFVRVVEQGMCYDCRTMGLGELCIIYIFWKLFTARNESICLIEEPETFISPAAQRALADLIATLCLSKRLWVVLTTHSPAVIERLPPESIRFLYHHNGHSQILTQGSKDAALKGLGLVPGLGTIVIVEDRVSREFFRLWAGEHDVDMLGRIELIDVGGAPAITAALRSFPKCKSLRLIGVYDGDQQASQLEHTETTPSYCFLPGTASVEAMLRAVANGRLKEVSACLGRADELVAVTLSQLAGCDDHDWLLDLSRSLGLTLEQTLHGLFRCWFAINENKELSGQAFAALAALSV